MRDGPWYRWRFNLSLITAVIVCLYLAQSFAADTTASPQIRVVGAVFFATGASGGVWRQWREIRAHRHRTNRRATTPGKPGG